jgi:competence protein ComEA
MFRNLIAAVFATLALNAFAAVDVNQASQAELESVKGIGPALSTKILDARKASSFKDWGDFVDRVGGVGPGNAARFSQAGLTVGGQAYGGAPAKPAKAKAEGDAEKSERKPARKPAETAAK